MDIAKLREDTEGCAVTTHLNNAGAALIPRPVHAAVIEHLQAEALHGSYEMAKKKAADLDDLYGCCAQLVHAASPTEIAVLESATHAWTTAFYSIPFCKGDVVLTCSSEYAANYVAMLQMKERKGIEVVEIKATTTTGEVDLEDLKKQIDVYGKRIKCVAITHIPTNGGLVNPCEAIGEIIKAPEVTVPYYLVDACQTVGQMPVDVEALQCDFLSATSRKYLRGPRGIGFLYVRSAIMDTLDPVTIDHFGAPWVATSEFQLRPDARRFEKWESNIANRLGLRAAVKYALEVGLDNIWDRVQVLSTALRQKLVADPRLKKSDGTPLVRVTDLGSTKCGIVTFLVDGVESKQLQEQLMEKYHINLSVSTRAATRLDMDRRDLDDLLRASVHYYNTDAELDLLVNALVEVAAPKTKKEEKSDAEVKIPVASSKPVVAPPIVAPQQAGGTSSNVVQPYDVILNQATFTPTNTKYYELKVVRREDGDYEAQFRWGRVGGGGQNMTAVHKTLESAVQMFEKKFRDKTGVDFEDRYSSSAQWREGKYKMLEVVADGDGGGREEQHPVATDEVEPAAMGA